MIPPIDDIDPDAPHTSSSSKTTSKKKDTTENPAKDSSSERGSSGITSRIPGSSTIVKDGILYIIDDDDIVAQIPEEAGSSEETVDAEDAYSAADLAAEELLRQQSLAAGFWGTVPGYLTMIAIILVLLLLALFFLFFGVIVTGEIEEHDEVFELCAIRLMKWKDGNWCVRLGSAFDENAVLKLRIGILFGVMFDEWTLTGETEGIYEGRVEGPISQNMLMYRKNIRRSL